MDILRALPDTVSDSCVLAIGNFDGVHPGHRAVIRAACARARRLGVTSSVMTFDPHTRLYFEPGQEPFLMTPFEEKARLIQSMGVERLIALPFDRSIADLDADSFIREILRRRLDACGVVVGSAFRFGRRRQGDGRLLQAHFGDNAELVAPILGWNGYAYGSTRARALLCQGDYKGAAEILGRWWSFVGEVVHGDALGRQLGYPTANVALDPSLLRPPLGVVAIRARIDESGPWRDGIASYGRRPSVGGEDLRFEAYLFDFSGDLYGRHLRIWPVCTLREEISFPDREALVRRIAADCVQARKILADPSLVYAESGAEPGEDHAH